MAQIASVMSSTLWRRRNGLIFFRRSGVSRALWTPACFAIVFQASTSSSGFNSDSGFSSDGGVISLEITLGGAEGVRISISLGKLSRRVPFCPVTIRDLARCPAFRSRSFLRRSARAFRSASPQNSSWATAASNSGSIPSFAKRATRSEAALTASPAAIDDRRSQCRHELRNVGTDRAQRALGRRRSVYTSDSSRLSPQLTPDPAPCAARGVITKPQRP